MCQQVARNVQGKFWGKVWESLCIAILDYAMLFLVNTTKIGHLRLKFHGCQPLIFRGELLLLRVLFR